MTISTRPELKSLNDAITWAEGLSNAELVDNFIAHTEAVVAHGTEHTARNGHEGIHANHRMVRNGIEDVVRQRMTENETYQGWTNRETYTFMLHVENDEGLEYEARQLAIQAQDSERDTIDALARELQDWMQTLRDEVQHGDGGEYLRMFVLEVGSEHRINYRDAAEHILEWVDDNHTPGNQ